MVAEAVLNATILPRVWNMALTPEDRHKRNGTKKERGNFGSGGKGRFSTLRESRSRRNSESAASAMAFTSQFRMDAQYNPAPVNGVPMAGPSTVSILPASGLSSFSIAFSSQPTRHIRWM